MNWRVASWRTTLPLGSRVTETVSGVPSSCAQKAAARLPHTMVWTGFTCCSCLCTVPEETGVERGRTYRQCNAGHCTVKQYTIFIVSYWAQGCGTIMQVSVIST